jgi:hypothetical protein
MPQLEFGAQTLFVIHHTRAHKSLVHLYDARQLRRIRLVTKGKTNVVM